MTFAASNFDILDEMQDSGLSPAVQRIYLHEVRIPDDIPPRWPTTTEAFGETDKQTETSDNHPYTPSPAHACVSIRPFLYELAVTRMLDAPLKAFLQSAPPGPASLLALYHEASTLGPAQVYKTYFDSLDKNFPDQGGAKGLLKKAQSYVRRRAREWNANVEVGAIEVANSKDSSGPALWMAPNLDFYAFAASTCCFRTFWRPGVTEPDDWDPADAAAIAALKAIFQQSSPQRPVTARTRTRPAPFRRPS